MRRNLQEASKGSVWHSSRTNENSNCSNITLGNDEKLKVLVEPNTGETEVEMCERKFKEMKQAYKPRMKEINESLRKYYKNENLDVEKMSIDEISK